MKPESMYANGSSETASDSDCIFCKIPSNSVVIEENGFLGKQCEKCGLIFIAPRPKLEDVVNLYGHDDAHISAADHIQSGFLKRLYAKQHINIINSHAQSGAVLDIGAGAGNFLTEARASGFTPYAIEFNPRQAQHIREVLEIPCEESAVSKGLFDGQLFDVVFHCDVISHMFDPVADFKAMNDIMKDDALLVFETGNLGDVDHKYFKHFDRFQYPDHLFFFSTDNLKNLLQQTGFELIHIHRYGITNEMRFVSTAHRMGNWAKSALVKLRTGAKTEKPNAPHPKKEPVSSPEPAAKKGSKVKTLLANAYKIGQFSFRYKLGSIKTKFEKPQTLIVVAQKRSNL